MGLTGTAANIQDHLALKEFFVLIDEVTIRIRSDCILQHSFMNVFKPSS